MTTTTRQVNLTGRLREWWRHADISTISLMAGIVLIAVIFQSLDPNFLTSRNFVNLLVQGSAMATIAMGIVFVLLLGEIDMSAGYVSGVGAAIMALLVLPGGDFEWPWWAAMGTAMATGIAIGTLHGTIVARIRIPSFIVTLAGFLAWNGMVLFLVGSRGSIGIQDPVITQITSGRLPTSAAWILLVAILAGWIFLRLRDRHLRKHADLTNVPILRGFLDIGVVGAIGTAVVVVAGASRGIPYVVVLVGIILALATHMLNNTRFGMSVYAVGGNAEAARRAGINVTRIKITCFAISSMLATVGGMILASRLRSVDTNTGGGSLLLYSIAAAVIGGTSLFGGRGSAMSAIKGAFVIAAIDNGLGLLGLGSAQKFMITGGVLLLAVTIDAMSRDRRGSVGRS